jgi:hypothetical protein
MTMHNDQNAVVQQIKLELQISTGRHATVMECLFFLTHTGKYWDGTLKQSKIVFLHFHSG